MQNSTMISERDLAHHFYHAYYARGKQYVNRVSELSVTNSSLGYILKALVQGSSYAPYQVSIALKTISKLDVEGTCTCPVRYNCKHVAATLIKAVRTNAFMPKDPVVAQRQEIDRWLQHYGATEHIPTAKPTQTELFYVIKEYQGELTLYLKTRRRLKNGGFGKEYDFKLNNYRAYNAPDYVGSEEALLLELLQKMHDNYYYGSSLKLTSSLGALIIDKLVASQKCFIGNERHSVLRYGEPLRFELRWNEYQKMIKLEYVAAHKDVKLINCDPYMYIDVKNALIAKAEGIFTNSKETAYILKAPSIPKEQSVYLAKKIHEVLPFSAIPLPANENIQTLFYPKITFCLELHHDIKTPFALLKARYDKHFVSLARVLDRELIADGTDALIQIERDRGVESDAIELIEAYGFDSVVRDGMQSLRFEPHADQPPVPLWHRFISEIREHSDTATWEISDASSFDIEVVPIETIDAQIDEGFGWFDLSFSISIEGKAYNTIPIITELLQQYDTPEQMPQLLYIHLEDQRYALLEKKAIVPIVETLFDLFGDQNEERFKLYGYDAPLLNDLLKSNIDFSGSQKLLEIAQKLQSFEKIERITPPEGLYASLREYQIEGISWMQFLREYGFGAILADDMGLGKTIQTLGHILIEKQSGRMDNPVLIVAPTSLMSNWKRECERFTPQLSVLVLQGSDRKTRFDCVEEYDIVLSTYPLIVRDYDALKHYEYYYLILDEAQQIKNHRSKAAQYLRTLKSRYRLCLTGTPMENHLGELWGLFDFVMPGFLFAEKFYNENFRYPVEKEGSSERQNLLNRRIRPFLLRRSKDEVIKELPPKTEIIHRISFDKKQAALYESIRIAMDKQVRDAIAKKGLARSQIMVLDALLKMRQVCCDPSLLKLEQAQSVGESAKLDALFDLLEELIEEKRRILLFSQFTQMLALIEKRLKKMKIPYSKLTGATRKRDEVIDAFKKGEVPLFLISLKAGGVGLNLTEADTVIHYDPWWNPAAENQATDRAYRIGQDKPVFVYKLIVENTLEEKILQLQERKQALADGVYSDKNDTAGLRQEDLIELFEPLQSL